MRYAINIAIATIRCIVPSLVIAALLVGGYKLHAKMPMQVYSSYVRRSVFSGVLQSYNLSVIKLQLMTLFSKLNLVLAVTKYSSH